ncbi:unnamed protein product [Symbiodinium natans]|uniref:AAA+ ATPase domain-containing protein n=1 Tax=Symbiodinium natans TaxID=878477 RepID=A0A812REQ6_9DINO|nr:unnamed protein product [Symbiodinium natans]
MARSQPRVVSIGDVSMSASDNLSPLVPTVPPRRGGLLREGTDLSSSELAPLRWMMQKALLRQDMFLLGPPGPLLRHTVFRFCELLRREVEYVGITRDTGEADLKQRCEIVDGSVKYVDQAPVRAAIHGRILVLEGIEKAERNVLPLLNNLLENREMSLEDRRFLLAPARAKQLREQFGSDQEFSQLVPVHEDFLVVALGLPERGNPLDPPLRSRFAALQLRPSLPSELVSPLAQLAPLLPISSVERLLTAASTLQDLAEGASDAFKIPGLDVASLGCAVRVLQAFPGADMRSVFQRVYPAYGFVRMQEPELTTIKKVVAELQNDRTSVSYSLEAVSLAREENKLPAARLRFRKFMSGEPVADVVEALAACGPFLRAEDESTPVTANEGVAAGKEEAEADQLRSLSAKELRSWLSACGVSHVGCFEKAEFLARAQDHLKKLQGSNPIPRPVGALSRLIEGLILTPSQASLLSDLLADHSAGADLALVGDKGSGKSAIVRAFASLLGYRTRSLFCYRDMSSRDLLQRRVTDPAGNTKWRDSPIVEAALCGDLAILDGAHRLAKGSLYATLAPLLSDRACALPDGTLLCSPHFWETRSEGGNLAGLGVRQVHPAFRLIACGESPESGTSQAWIDEEVSTLFHFHAITALPSHEQRSLAARCAGVVASKVKDKPIDQLLSYSEAAKAAVSKDADLKPLQLSLRALLRASRHLSLRPEDTAGAMARAFSARFALLPGPQRLLGEKMLAEAGIIRPAPRETDLTASEEAGELQVGGVRCRLRTPVRPELVPKVHFIETPAHMAVLQSMLVSWTAGQHLLLVGNQGVGKNKLADHLLGLLHCEREYVQLHRDTTVQSLTLTPTLEAGVVGWQDSALIRAARAGRCLVVDEADKAPLEVVCVLKALAEDGELSLPDGHTLVRSSDSRLASAGENEFLPIADGFRMIVLANRPGFPFLGNDFYRVCGDVFDCHAVECLDTESELELLRQTAPRVPQEKLAALSNLFMDLRQLSDSGQLTYPYSTRDLVKLAVHAQNFPGDSSEELAANVFGFDAFQEDQRHHLLKVLRRHGIAKGKAGEAELFGERRGRRNLQLIESSGQAPVT